MRRRFFALSSFALSAMVVAAFLAVLAVGGTPAAAAPAEMVIKQAVPSGDARFISFVQRLWPLAKARGVSRAIFDQAFLGVTPDP